MSLPQKVGTNPPTPPSKGKAVHEDPRSCGKPPDDWPDRVLTELAAIGGRCLSTTQRQAS